MPLAPLTRQGLGLSAAVLALAVAACGTPPDDDLRAVVRDYRDGWLRGDSAAVLELFAPDAVLLPHHGDPPVAGIDAIRRFWWPASAPPTRVTALEQTTDGVQVDGRTGVVWGRFELAFTWDEDGVTKSRRNGGTYLMVLRRETDGRWLITHRMWDDPVAQPQ
ncbi:MAG TPA: nuclear transport factor 2 family protein [Gemmatimonadales bacterium]|nr:nuclear transport factor 2 family protein [Gemmatimonadales bacterium]